MAKLTSPIGGFLDINNPEFLKQFRGQKLALATKQGQIVEGGSVFEVRKEGVFDIGAFDPTIENQNVIGFGKEQGLAPFGRTSFGTKEAFKFFTTPEQEAARIVTSNFGAGQGDFRDRLPGESQQKFLEEKQKAGIGDIVLPKDALGENEVAPGVARIPFTKGLTNEQKIGIDRLVGSGRVFNQSDAKNFADSLLATYL